MNRLGLNGPEEVKNHPWLKEVNWEMMMKMTAEPPFKLNSSMDNFDKRVSISEEAEETAKLNEKDEKTNNDMFAEYFFNIHEDNSGSSKLNK